MYAGTSTDMRLDIGVCMIPHPDKAYKGGEDAFFISENRQMLGESLCTLLYPSTPTCNLSLEGNIDQTEPSVHSILATLGL